MFELPGFYCNTLLSDKDRRAWDASVTVHLGAIEMERKGTLKSDYESR